MPEPIKHWLRRHWPWLAVILTVLLALAIRVRLREMPLERDEGEYAYAGQLILQGVPPYKEVYNMKLPGTYAAYALTMAIFGESPAGIHLGLALVNAASIVLVFLIGRRLLDDAAGVAAALAFALLSTSPSVLGLAGHATHFVTLFALAGVLVLLRATNPESKIQNPEPGIPDPVHQPSTISHKLLPFAGGLLFGLAFLMKQHGIFFGLFGGLYLLWTGLTERFERKTTGSTIRRSRRGNKAQTNLAPTSPFALPKWKELAVYTGGFILPYALTCLILWLAGAFREFIFWTISYAGIYAKGSPFVTGRGFLGNALDAVIGPSLLLWLIPWLGAVLIWWENRLTAGHRVFLTMLLVCSVASVLVGSYFRPHYFFTLLPVMSLLTGAAVSRSLRLLKYDKTIELFLALPVLGLFLLGTLASLIGNGTVWFSMSAAEASQEVYRTNLFSEAMKAADFVRANSPKSARVAILGSEPEIYFYARRRAGSGYIYVYPLMERQPYALKMQEQMIAEIERARPEYVIYVDDNFSWLPNPDSNRKILDWWPAYWAANLDLVKTMDFREGPEETVETGKLEEKVARSGGGTKHLLIFRRK